MPTGPSETFWERDRRLAAEGRPPCPRCGERDRLELLVGLWFCNRCNGFLPALSPREKRHVPDF